MPSHLVREQGLYSDGVGPLFRFVKLNLHNSKLREQGRPLSEQRSNTDSLFLSTSSKHSQTVYSSPLVLSLVMKRRVDEIIMSS